jgi:hypothetical protein
VVRLVSAAQPVVGELISGLAALTSGRATPVLAGAGARGR